MSPADQGPSMAREYAAARFGEDRDRGLIAAAFMAGWDAALRVSGLPVYRARAEGEPAEDFPHTLDGMRAAMDAAVLLAERCGKPARCVSADNGTERLIRVYDPAARNWSAVLGGEQS